MLKRLALGLVLVLTGVATGLVVAGQLRTPDEAAVETAPAADPGQAPAPQAAAPGRLAAGPDFTAVAAQTVAAVTNISSLQVVRQRTSPFMNDPFFQQFFGDMGPMFGSRDRYASSLGSGVIVSPDGLVVTNHHVLGEGRIAEVTVALADRRELRATIVGVDPWTDLALLKVDATNLPVIPWGDSTALRVAEWVMAIGNPYQLNQTVTLGIVSAVGRTGIGISTYEDFIQTDAAINPGNSGGALVNARGELVGVNTAIFTESGGYQGIGFAVPSRVARRVVDDLARYGEVRRGSIGYIEVAPLTTRLAAELQAPTTDGVVITRMLPRTAAHNAGIQPGDIIVSVNGEGIGDPAQLLRVVADLRIGSEAAVEVLRQGRRLTFQVAVERQEAPRRRG